MEEGAFRLELGARPADGRGVFFRVWAPGKKSVSVQIFSSSSQPVVRLTADESGYFTGFAEGAAAGDRYLYILDSDGSFPDPASRFQPEGVHRPSQIVDPHGFHWDDPDWKGISLPDSVIYEIHVGAFTEEGTFSAVIPRLDYLIDLGITAIELMPVAQFPGARNWGYDGVFPFAPQNTYGGPAGLKGLVNACHRKGLSLILDVVYNHLGPEGNYLGRFGPYFTSRYLTPWGDAVNFDGPYSDEVRRFFMDNALYWIDEFHVDAIRVDAVHGIFDSGASPFLKELCEAVHSRGKILRRRVGIIAESDLNDARVILPGEACGYGFDAQWNDDFHHALHSLITGESGGYYADFGKTQHLEKAYREGFVYTGQHSGYRKRRHGNSPAGCSSERFIVFSQSHDQVGNRQAGDRLSGTQSFEKLKLAAGAFILSPFIPLLFMGEEYGETAPFIYFTSHSDPDVAEAVREGRKREFTSFAWAGDVPDPQDEKNFHASKLNLTLSGQGSHAHLYRFYSRLLRLRKKIPALFHLSKRDMETRRFENEKALLVRRWADNDQVVIIYNFAEDVFCRTIELPCEGWTRWLESSSELWGGRGGRSPDRIEDKIAAIALAPHSFALYRMTADSGDLQDDPEQ